MGPRAEETDWYRIVLLYDALLQINPFSVVALNLDAAATLAGDSALASYHLFPSVRGGA